MNARAAIPTVGFAADEVTAPPQPGRRSGTRADLRARGEEAPAFPQQAQRDRFAWACGVSYILGQVGNDIVAVASKKMGMSYLRQQSVTVIASCYGRHDTFNLGFMDPLPAIQI